MTYDFPSARTSEFDDSRYDGSSDGPHAADERRLYGEPHHEPRTEYDEQALYGDPQHEPRDENDDSRDIEVLFARMQAAPVIRPRTLGPRTPSAVETTER
ncbi:hypothetical protein [Halorussus amylolyticus]|uniref:hypothetical protein n=1 Tax=Halorussus amylolyticus TaxID=1126242 RepID=UPI0010501A7F|nr:hypothetical protein [Halorussus amylolyticus]